MDGTITLLIQSGEVQVSIKKCYILASVKESIVIEIFHNLFIFHLADMPMERKTPVSYPDGSYEMIPEQPRGNVLLISNVTQHGFSGRGSRRRTAFFTFFGNLKLLLLF